jgi:DNA repair protein RecO
MNPLASQRLTGIPLARFEAKPGSWVLVFFTLELGQIRVHSRTPSRKKSGIGASPSFFSTFSFQVQSPRSSGGLFELLERELAKHRARLGKGQPLAPWASASFLGDLLMHTTETQDPHPYLFRMLEKALDLLEAERPDAEILVAFLLKFLEHMGFRPQIETCACGKPPDFRQPVHFDSISAGLRCPGCPPPPGDIAGCLESRHRLNEGQWKSLRDFRLARFESLSQTGLDPIETSDLVFALAETAAYHFGVRLKSLDFWREAHKR